MNFINFNHGMSSNSADLVRFAIHSNDKLDEQRNSSINQTADKDLSHHTDIVYNPRRRGHDAHLSRAITSSNSSITSHYANKIFEITCIIVMISCFAILILFAFFAGIKEVNSMIHVEKAITDRDSHSNSFKDEECSIEIVESIPKILKYPQNAVKHPATYDAWNSILGLIDQKNGKISSISNQDIKIASAYWTLRSSDVNPVNQTKPNAAEGETILAELKRIAQSGGAKLTIVNSYPGSISQGNDTDELEAAGAEVGPKY